MGVCCEIIGMSEIIFIKSQKHDYLTMDSFCKNQQGKMSDLMDYRQTVQGKPEYKMALLIGVHRDSGCMGFYSPRPKSPLGSWR